MAVAHVTSSQSHSSGAFSVSQASFSWTHTTTTNPQGVLILVFQGVSATNAATSVTYDGTNIPAVTGGAAHDTATEPGSVTAFFLGSGVPTTDNPTVVVNRTNNTTTMWAVCITVTAATDTEVAGIVLAEENGVIAEQSVDDGSTGVDSVRYSGVYYGGASPAPAGANSSLLLNNDAGAYGWTAVREATAGQGARLVGCTQATSDDRAIVALAIREVYVPPGPTITAFETADWTGTGTPKTISVPGAVTGDLILVMYGGDNGTGGGTVSAATVTTTGGSTGTWSEPEEGLAAGSQAWASSASATVTADGTVTVALARTQSTGLLWGGFALLAHNHGGIGAHARSAPSATETASLAVSQDSAVGVLALDWDALAAVAFSPAGALEVQRAQAGAGPDLTDYAAYWLAQAAGTRGYGIATSSTTNLHIIAIEILAASTGTDLVVADTAQAQSADLVALTQIHSLVVQDAAQAQTSDPVALTQVHQLAVAAAVQTQAAEQVTVNVATNLFVADAAQAQTAELVTLAAAGDLTVANATQAQAADLVALTQIHQLTVQNATQAQAADSVILSLPGALQIQDAAQAQTADLVALTQAHSLIVQDTAQAQTADQVTTAQTYNLTVQPATQAQAADQVTLTFETILTVADAAQAQTAGLVALTQLHQLSVGNGQHAMTADTVPLTQLHLLLVAAALQAQTADLLQMENIAPLVPRPNGGTTSRPSSGTVPRPFTTTTPRP